MRDAPLTRASFVRRGYGWEATLRIRDAPPVLLAVQGDTLTDDAVAAVRGTWNDRAALLREARRYVGRETLVDDLEREQGMGRHHLDRLGFDERGALRSVMFAYPRSYTLVAVSFLDGAPRHWDIFR